MLTPEQLKTMSPDQIAAYVAAMAKTQNAGVKTSADTDSSDVDIDGATEGGAPPPTEGDFDFDILRCERYMSADQGNGSVPMFRVFFKVVSVLTQGPVRDAIDGVDENPPPGPVMAGEERRWSTRTTSDKNNQNNLVRIRSMIQAAMRFEPGSKLAETAIGPDGAPIKWAGLLKEATGENNPLAGLSIRGTVTRIITKKNKRAMYVPTWGVSPRAVARTDNKVTGF